MCVFARLSGRYSVKTVVFRNKTVIYTTVFIQVNGKDVFSHRFPHPLLEVSFEASFLIKIEKTRKNPGQFLYFNDALNFLKFSSEIKALDR